MHAGIGEVGAASDHAFTIDDDKLVMHQATALASVFCVGEGSSALEAARFSAQSRLRPILMTAISSLTGFLPLMLASGAGAQSQSSLGLVVFGGLLVATFLSTLVVPVFYVVMKTLLGQADAKPSSDPQLSS